jgi:hypothetical protein
MGPREQPLWAATAAPPAGGRLKLCTIVVGAEPALASCSVERRKLANLHFTRQH